MHIFVPKASGTGETRTALTPDSAKKLIGLGLKISAETNLGHHSDHADAAYEAVGVTITTDRDAMASADIVFNVEPPTAVELASQKPDSLFIGPLEPFNNPDLIRTAASSRVQAVSMEMIPRTTIAQKMDIISSQANLAGYMAVIRAAERSSKLLPMMMTPAGTLAPARVFIVGVGVAGLQAIATAKRLGARVFAFDTRPVVEEQVKSLGAKFVKIDIGETGETKDGYAKALTPEQLEMQRQGMQKVCAQSDVVVTTAKLFGRKAPIIITKSMVEAMQPGSIIVDLAAETGGNVEGTIAGEEIITPNGVRIIGTNKLEQDIPMHASQMFAANLANFVEHFWDSEASTLNLNLEDEIIAGCLLTQGGEIIHPRFKELTELA